MALRRNKLRTTLTGFAILWGIFMLIVLLSAGNGLKNGVTTTPTFFLNGRRIEGLFDLHTIMSMLEEAVAAE